MLIMLVVLAGLIGAALSGLITFATAFGLTSAWLSLGALVNLYRVFVHSSRYAALATSWSQWSAAAMPVLIGLAVASSLIGVTVWLLFFY